MTFSTSAGHEGSTTMASTVTRMIRATAVATAVLALSATAAQARPLEYSTTNSGNASSGAVTAGYHGSYRPAALTRLTGSIMSPAVDPANAQQAQTIMSPAVDPANAQQARTIMSPGVDPANAQQVPVVVTQTAPAKAVASGFNWTASLLGAGIATIALLLAAVAASRVRPRRIAQF
jgi:hypothetical protein